MSESAAFRNKYQQHVKENHVQVLNVNFISSNLYSFVFSVFETDMKK